MESILDAMEHLQSVLQKEAPKSAVSCEIFFNSEGFNYTFKHRSAQQLINDGISMQNLAGEFIALEGEDE